jgi:Zn-dependent protease
MLPGGGIKIARIFGIEILINPTWIVIFGLVGFSLSETMKDVSVKGHPGIFPAGPWPWIFGFGTAIVFFACLLAHELSHSWVAKRHGVNIRRITLFIFGGVAEMS